MLCRWHRHRIASALDRDAPLPAATTAHLLRCPACRAWRDGQARLAARLRTDAPPVDGAPPSLVEQSLRRVRHEGTVVALPRPARRLAPLALAACLCLLLGVGALVWRQARHAQAERERAVRAALALGELAFADNADAHSLPGHPLALPALFSASWETQIGRLRADTVQTGRFLRDVLPLGGGNADAPPSDH
ncbi:MAG: hypothetical protein ACOCX4_04605 [Planctomycetota bacterium]